MGWCLRWGCERLFVLVRILGSSSSCITLLSCVFFFAFSLHISLYIQCDGRGVSAGNRYMVSFRVVAIVVFLCIPLNDTTPKLAVRELVKLCCCFGWCSLIPKYISSKAHWGSIWCLIFVSNTQGYEWTWLAGGCCIVCKSQLLIDFKAYHTTIGTRSCHLYLFMDICNLQIFQAHDKLWSRSSLVPLVQPQT